MRDDEFICKKCGDVLRGWQIKMYREAIKKGSSVSGAIRCGRCGIVYSAADVANANDKNGCFIATACYEHKDHPDVLMLRHFRDDYLLLNQSGRLFVKFYYIISPTIASIISKRLILRKICLFFLKPLVALIKK